VKRQGWVHSVLIYPPGACRAHLHALSGARQGGRCKRGESVRREAGSASRLCVCVRCAQRGLAGTVCACSVEILLRWKVIPQGPGACAIDKKCWEGAHGVWVASGARTCGTRGKRCALGCSHLPVPCHTKAVVAHGMRTLPSWVGAGMCAWGLCRVT